MPQGWIDNEIASQLGGDQVAARPDRNQVRGRIQHVARCQTGCDARSDATRKPICASRSYSAADELTAASRLIKCISSAANISGSLMSFCGRLLGKVL
jgi:hypothetical protein